MRNDIIKENGDRIVRGLRQYVHGISENYRRWDSNRCSDYLKRQGWRIICEKEDGQEVRVHIHPNCQKSYSKIDGSHADSVPGTIRQSPPINGIDNPLVLHALNLYTTSLKLLKALNVLSNQKDFTSQFGEYLIAKWKGGEIADSGNQKDWDVQFSDGSKAQVKSHAKAPTTTAEFTAFDYDEDAKFDLFYIVVFNHEYSNVCVYEMTKAEAMVKKKNGTLLWSRVKNHIKYDGPIW